MNLSIKGVNSSERGILSGAMKLLMTELGIVEAEGDEYMKYIGLFSGKIFNTKEDAGNAEECCVNVDDEDERLNNKAVYENWRTEQLVKCISCFGCPQANR